MTEPSSQVLTDDGVTFDGDFNADRAKSLIERLREENKSLKGSQTPQDAKDASAIAALRRQVEELKPKADQFTALEQASKSETQRLSEAAAAAQSALATAQAEATRYKVAATHGIPAEHFDLLGNGSEEQVTANALKIAALLAAQTVATTPPVTPSRLTVEQMRPGATPAGTETAEDVDYARLFGPGK